MHDQDRGTGAAAAVEAGAPATALPALTERAVPAAPAGQPGPTMAALAALPRGALLPTTVPGTYLAARRLPASREDVAAATGVGDEELQLRLVSEALDALPLPAGLPGDEEDRRLVAAVALMKEIAPRSGLEGMLAAQMVGVHGTAMDCLQRAVAEGGQPGVRERELRQATRLLALCARQMDVLSRHRAEGRRRIEHVHMRAPAIEGEARGRRREELTVVRSELIGRDGRRRPLSDLGRPEEETA